MANTYAMQKNPSPDCGSALVDYSPTIEQQLSDERIRLTDRLAEVEEGLALVQEHPEIMRLLNILKKRIY